MPWASGNFTRSDGTRSGTTIWTKAKNAAVKIISSDHDTHDQDLADGVDSCINKDGSNAMTGDLDLGANNITNAANFVTGTFTPTIYGASTAGTFAYGDQVGNYVLLGDLVYINVYITGTWSSDPSGFLRVGGLPETPSSADTILSVTHLNLTSDNIIIANPNSSGYLDLRDFTSSGGRGYVSFADQVANLHELTITGAYIKA